MKFNDLHSGDYFKLKLPKDAEMFFTIFANGRYDLFFKKLDAFHAVSQAGRIEHFHPVEEVQFLESAPHGWPEGL